MAQLLHHVRGRTAGVRVDVDGELSLQDGDQHLAIDASLPASDAAATDLVVERVLAFLARVGSDVAAPQ